MQESCTFCESDCDDVERVYVEMDAEGDFNPVCGECRRMLWQMLDGGTFDAVQRHVDVEFGFDAGDYLRDCENRYWLVDGRLIDVDVDWDEDTVVEWQRRKYRLKRPRGLMASEEKVVDEEWMKRMDVDLVEESEAEEEWSDRVSTYGGSD